MEAELARQEDAAKAERFRAWCEANGARMPKLEYPAVFAGGLVGVRVKEDIEHNEAFLSVPMKMQITVDKARETPELRPVFLAHPDMFDAEENDDFEHHILEAFILFEMQKGPLSFWHPYFEVFPKITNFWEWDVEDIRQTDDPFITVELDKIRRYVGSTWSDMSMIFRLYPEVFKPGFITKELFRHVEMSVCSRVFGYSIPCTALIPMADMLNHSDIDVQYEVFNKRLHLIDKQNTAYYTRSKYMFDYSYLYSKEELESISKDERQALNVKGRFNQFNFRANQKRYQSTESFAQQVELGIRLWDIPWVNQRYEQDNDTEDEDDEEEDEEEETKNPSLVKEIEK